MRRRQMENYAILKALSSLENANIFLERTVHYDRKATMTVYADLDLCGGRLNFISRRNGSEVHSKTQLVDLHSKCSTDITSMIKCQSGISANDDSGYNYSANDRFLWPSKINVNICSSEKINTFASANISQHTGHWSRSDTKKINNIKLEIWSSIKSRTKLAYNVQCNNQLRMDVYAVIHQCAGDEESHRLEDVDKVEQTLCGDCLPHSTMRNRFIVDLRTPPKSSIVFSMSTTRGKIAQLQSRCKECFKHSNILLDNRWKPFVNCLEDA
ncbi:hypothetical protein ANN_14502 [Periplaneta americana]|uniref:Uncharacterized protein n=1 Tax=Periplaneta americana TaxID=6978 RepID=A0ABQ8SYL7_PERAM|nr:hypothetical protein ANN_14502 [Periplaneta americana]